MSDPKKMSDPDPIDIYESLQFFPNPDGTVTRKLDRFPTTPATTAATAADVLSKDIPINPSKSTFARLYLPRTAVDHHSGTKTLPLIIYIHGGGFILFTVDSAVNHDFCSAMSLHLPAVVVSVGYRLAPEHRLPAAYEDAAEAIHRLKTAADEPWLRDHADFTNCYLMGTSAGGNIAYHAALRIDGPDPSMRIRGVILHHPFFGGSHRTESELRTEKPPIFPWVLFDFMWEQALPEGADRDHEYCNPTKSTSAALEKKMKEGLMKVMVTGWDEDPLFDRQVEVARMMEEKGIEVKGIFGKGGSHGLELADQSAAAALFAAIRDFIAT